MISSIRKATVLWVVVICLLIPCGTEAYCAPEPTTIVQAAVYFGAPDQLTYAPGAKIMVQGDFVILSAVTNSEGKIQFSNLEPGTYIIEATYFGLHDEQKITVEAGSVVQVALQLKLPDLKISPQS